MATKILEYTFDKTIGDCLPYLEPTSIAMTKSDTSSGNIITRTISVNTMPTKINFYSGKNRNALKSVTYVNISSVKSLRDFCNSCSNVESILIENQTAPNLNDMWAFAKNSPKLTSVKLLNVTSPNPIEFSGAFSDNKTLTEIVITGKLKPASMYQSFLRFQGTTLDLTSIDISECTSLYQCFLNCTNLETIDLSTWKTNKVTNMNNMFDACYKLKSLDLNNLDISNVKHMSAMFFNCGSLEELNIQNWDTSNVLVFGSMFALCKSLPSSFWDLTWMDVSSATDISGMFRGLNLTSTDEINISNWNTSNVVSMEGMFQDCKYITKIDISFLNTSKLNNISSMFRNCNALTDINISTFDLSRCSSFYELCWNCGKLKSLDFLKGLDISGVTYWLRAFGGCYELTDISALKDMKFVYRTSLMQVLDGCRKIENWEVLSTWDVTGVYHFGSAFVSTNIDSLSYMKDWNMSNAENIAGMFNNNSIITSLEPIRNWNTSNVNDMGGLCSNIKKLTSLEPIKNWDTSKVTNMSNAFSNGVGENLEFDLNWDMSNVTNMGDMFLGSKFKKINLSNKNLSKVTSFYRTFYNCTVTEEIDLSGTVATSAVNTYLMFGNCYKLRYLDLSSFSGELITNITAMFENTKLETIDLSNMRVDKLSSTDCWNAAGSSDKTLAFLYVDATNINKFINNYKTRFPNSGLTIYYHEANPSDLVVKDGVTYIKYNTPNSMQIPNKEMYSLPDGTRDELDIETGVLTHNIGECTWNDSTVGWGVSIGDGSTTFYHLGDWGVPNYGTIQQDMNLPLEVNGNNTIVISPNVIGVEVWGNAEVRKMNIHVPMKFNDENEAKQWLKENQVTFIYRKETPTTEKLILNHNHSCEYGMVLPTGAMDYYNLVTKEYSQNISSINLTGEDVWDESIEYENTVRFLYVSHTDIKMKASGGLYCDNDLFPNIQDDSDVEHCRVHETDDNKLYIFINKDRLMSPDLIGWQIWLQENPFNVYYERTETLTVIREYEELDTQLARWEMIDCYDNGTIDIENNDINTRIYSDLSYDCKSINNFEIKSLLPNETYTVYADNMMDNPTIYLGGNTHSFTSNRPYLSGDDKWVRFYTYTISKNLYNKENYLKAWIDDWGIIRYGDNDILCDYVSIKPSTNYTYRVYSPVDHNTRFGWYDADKKFIKRVNSDSCNAGNVTFQSPSNAYYVRVSSSDMISMGYDVNIGLYEGDTTPDIFEPYQKKFYTYDATNLMIIKGDISNEVVPYFEGAESVRVPSITTTKDNKMSILSTSSDVILRSNGDVKDEYNAKTGELTQRIGENGEILPQEVIRQIDFNIEYKESDKKYLVGVFDKTTNINISSDGLPPIIDIAYTTNEDTLATITTDRATVTDAKADTYIQRAILKGNTLVNVVSSYWFSDRKNSFNVNLKQYKIGQSYIFIMFDVPSNTTEIYLGDGSGSIMWSNYTNNFTRNKNAVMLKVTCPSNYDGSTILPHLRYSNNEEPSSIDNIKCMLIEYQQGMESWYIPYFKGMQSVKMPVLTTTNEDGTKTNILSCNEEVELCVVGNVKDELNLLTGEMTKRYGVAIMDGSDDENYIDNYDEISFVIYGEVNNQIFSNMKENSYNILCDKYYVAKDGNDGWRIHNDSTATGIYWFNNNLWIRIPLENLGGSHTKQAFKTWLQSNPITIQYELATPVVKTVDLTLTKQGCDELQIKQLPAYENGQILLSSESGLIPTLTYSVPSTNTFHLPSMKTGTRYTLKYPSASGNIAIGNIKYNINSPSMLFTTPLTIIGDTSAIIFSDENPQDVMLIEGAYNTREIPLFTGVKSVVNPTINIIDNGTEESRTYRCQEEVELRSLPNGVADKLDIVGGKLTRAVGIRPYQEGDEDLPNTLTDGYNTIYQLSKPTVSSVTFVTPVVTSDSTMHLSSEALIPQLNYRVPSNNNFPLDLLEPNKTYTLYANTLVNGSYTLGGTHNGYFTGTEVIALGDVTNNLLTFDGDLGLSDVVLIKGNSMNSELPYFEGLKTVENATITIAGMQGEENLITLDDSITLRACGDIKDTIDMVNLVMTQNLSEITLKGTEPWSLITTNESINDEYVLFGLVIGGIKSSVTTSLVCDKFNHKYQSGEMHNQEGIYAVNNQLRICVKKTTIGGETVDAIKTWLGQNNTRVIYALINPIEYQLQNSWTSTPPTSYNNRTTISSQVVDSLKPMISVTIATTTLEEIVSNLETRNTQLEEENLATMLALTSVYELMSTSSVTTTETQVPTYGGMSVSPMGMVYAKLVSKGFKTIEEVPYNLQAEVMYALRGME